MARVQPTIASETSSRDIRSSSYHRRSSPRRTPATSPSPSPSLSSDKENRLHGRANDAPMERPAKRQRSIDRPLITETQAARVSDNPDLAYYDPNQDVDERRQVRKGLRELNREAVDLRQEWLAPGTKLLKNAVIRADSIYQSVRQTSDATMDSRLLVTVGDLAYKKTQQMVLGDGAQGIDVDEFVSKCIAFMNRGTEANFHTQSATQRRRRQADAESDEEEGLEQGDGLNWSWFGAKACFPSNSRPPVPGFLLGPLSLQKRVRTQTQRRGRLQKQSAVEATRPEELAAADLKQAENQTLTAMCKGVHKQFLDTVGYGRVKAQEEATDDMTEEEEKELLKKYNLTEQGGIPLFSFAINPNSFGQTVENLFYISFLIREGRIGIDIDKDGIPEILELGNGESAAAPSNTGGEKHQAVFSLDFETWQELVEVFEIREPLIPDRTREPTGTQIGARGWYS